MIAICSDLDETPDRQVYMEIMKYLNTTERTVMGDGLGLEVGNTIYFDMPAGQFSYWNTDDEGRDYVRALIRSGHIDCLHSYGDLATTRAHAERALEDLNRHGCRLEVWVDHATAPSNFGADIMRGSGDVPGSPAYHADLTCNFGIRYVWRGRVTSVIGQNVKRNLKGIFNMRHPLLSSKTMLKEIAKGLLANIGNEMYAMHSNNQILRGVKLRDGYHVNEFIRANNHWGGVDCATTAEGLADVLSKETLECLVVRGGATILYTHIGKIRSRVKIFGEPTKKSLILLSKYYFENKILVTTTKRLLNYYHTLQNATVSQKLEDGYMRLDLNINGLQESNRDIIQGITIYVDKFVTARLFVNGIEYKNIIRNPVDQSQRESISIPWKRIQYSTK